MTRRILAPAAAALALLAGVPASGQQATYGGTFTLPINDDPQMWPLVGGIYNIMVNKALYSTLLRYDPQTLRPVGDLAQSYVASSDAKTYTFNLRQNVKWHDGTPFTAKDVVFTIGVWKNPRVPFFLRSNFNAIQDVKAVGDYRVIITLNKPQPSFPSLLGYLANILPEHKLGKLAPEQLANPTEFLKNPVGTGPFKFDRYQPGAFVRLVRNDAYFAGRPYLDALVYRVVPDANSQLALLRSGELDFVPIEPFQLDALKNAPNIRVQTVPVVRTEFIALNNGLPALKDARVRQALTLGLNRQQILETVFDGKGRLATGPITPAVSWAFNNAVKPLPYDPEQAKRLLDEAGWKPGANGVRQKDGQPLSLKVLYDPGNPTRARTALIAQQQWKALGVDVTFETAEYGTVVSRIRKNPPEFEANPNYLITPPDPDGLAGYYVTGSSANSWRYSNPQVDKLFKDAADEPSQVKRAALYKQVQELIYKDNANVFTVYPDEIHALSNAVTNFPKAGFRDALAWAHLIAKR